MIYGSVCSGIEAATVAWHPLGWHPAFFSEIEAFPRAVLSHHFPEVPLHGDFTTIEDGQYEPIDLLVGGTPCFAASTLIASRRGLIPISHVIIGDEVLTHKNRWKRVLNVGSKLASTIRLCGQGNSRGVITTQEHPFYSRAKLRGALTNPEWVEASDMLGRFWATPTAWPASEAPPIESIGRETDCAPMSAALAWVIGRWLGDGWCRVNARRGYVLICCSFGEAEELSHHLVAAGLHASRNNERTTVRFQIANRALARWLSCEFGSGAGQKTMPTWLFGWQHRAALLDGYISADGHDVPGGQRITTISDKLALGAVLLTNSLGKSASRSQTVPSRSASIIEGRTVNEQPFWQVTIYERARSSVELDGHRWGLVRSVEPAEKAIVWNLEVEGDNSYVADGYAVHNCQDFSIAGLRAGLAGDRGNLTLQYLALAQRLRPRWLVWENVPGALSSTSHAAPDLCPPQDPMDMGCDGQEMEMEDEYASEELHALNCFLAGLSELGYGFAYGVLDAQHFGVPQRRARIFLVGYLGDWRRAAAVLFERHSLQGHSPPSREKGQGVAGALTDVSPGGGWRCGADEAAAGQIVAAPNSQGSRLDLGAGYAESAAHLVAGTLGANGKARTLQDAKAGLLIAHPLRAQAQPSHRADSDTYIPVAFGGNNTAGPIDCATALAAHGGPHGRLDFASETFIVTAFSCKDHGADAGDIAPTLRAMGHSGSHANAGGQIAVAFNHQAASTQTTLGYDPEAGTTGSLSVGQTPAVCITGDITHTLKAEGFDASEDGTGRGQPIVAQQQQGGVRRLTPEECEALQGFPRGYTQIPYRRKPAADGPRYKALGNSFAVPVIRWIGERIQLVEEICLSAKAAE